MCNQQDSNTNQTETTYRIYSTFEKKEDALQQIVDFFDKRYEDEYEYEYFAIKDNSSNRTYITSSWPVSLSNSSRDFDNRKDSQLKYHHDFDVDESFQISTMLTFS